MKKVFLVLEKEEFCEYQMMGDWRTEAKGMEAFLTQNLREPGPI